MNDMLKSMKELLSFYWTPAKTPQDKVIKRYDLLIFVGVIFITLYVGHWFFIGVQNTDPIQKPSITFKYNEFSIGDVVCVKDFGIYGKVTQKILGTTGYTYEVRWRDDERELPKDVFYPWELEKATVPISVLRN